MGRVEGKAALVTGAGGGIGGAGAEALAREGAAVLCTDVDATAAEATAVRIRAAGGRAASLGLDVRDRAAVDEAVAMAVREFGRLDILLDCAGISHRGNFLDLDPATWDRIIAVNLTGMFHLGQAAVTCSPKTQPGGDRVRT
jgi:2-hydroxycyclohexanecarboxyl-CoA dehydrogenase